MILTKNVKVQTRRQESRKVKEGTWEGSMLMKYPIWEYRTATLEGEITVSIDLEAVIKHLGPKAVRAKTKRAQEASGMLVVTASNIKATSITDWAPLK
jgi:hypothetical protein